MKQLVALLVLLSCVSEIACTPANQGARMENVDFFSTPPKAERASLSATGICIETEPLEFTDPTLDRELEPEILLEGLSLPSIEPAQLANTRYTPDSDYEGSFYFLAEHNLVDLKEIRFLNASANSVLAEYDLLIHLPTTVPNEYPITIRVQTEIENRVSDLAEPRSFDGLGTLMQDEEDLWKGNAVYDGYDVEIAISAGAGLIDEIATFATLVISEHTLPRSKMNDEIADELNSLSKRFERLNVTTEFKASEFIPRRFYFYKRRHHENPEVIIGIDHPANDGHWSLTFYNLDRGNLIFQPRNTDNRPRNNK